MSDEEHDTHEIVIVKRHHGGAHDEPHGGVWKVAFADFMTAMMAFFLVLWIVNSTSKETRSSVARYFNPIRLSDTTPARKGLNDPKEEDFDASDSSEKAEPKKDKQAGAEHAAESKDKKEKDAKKEGAKAEAQKAFHDPFDGMRAASAAMQEQDQEAQALYAEVSKALGAEDMAKTPGAFAVKADKDGLLISLSDGLDFTMFAVASAEPEPRLSQALIALAQALQKRPGALIVRGHTDARRYKSGDLENWRLSSARAQAALALLIRDGLPSARFERVEGHADHDLRNPNDPLAPENRRIEILLRKDTK
ncbi:MAG: OmpA family protein [Hyphomicrobiales bacterium]|nr:OmpA family protein [Hyphomicrobiales bacterium]